MFWQSGQFRIGRGPERGDLAIEIYRHFFGLVRDIILCPIFYRLFWLCDSSAAGPSRR